MDIPELIRHIVDNRKGHQKNIQDELTKYNDKLKRLEDNYKKEILQKAQSVDVLRLIASIEECYRPQDSHFDKQNNSFKIGLGESIEAIVCPTWIDLYAKIYQNLDWMRPEKISTYHALEIPALYDRLTSMRIAWEKESDLPF